MKAQIVMCIIILISLIVLPSLATLLYIYDSFAWSEEKEDQATSIICLIYYFQAHRQS